MIIRLICNIPISQYQFTVEEFSCARDLVILVIMNDHSSDLQYPKCKCNSAGLLVVRWSSNGERRTNQLTSAIKLFLAHSCPWWYHKDDNNSIWRWYYRWYWWRSASFWCGPATEKPWLTCTLMERRSTKESLVQISSLWSSWWHIFDVLEPSSKYILPA